MKKFLDWLAEGAGSAKAIAGYAALAALLVVSLDHAVTAALVNWGVVDEPPLPKAGEHPFKYYKALMFADLFLLAPVLEELLFRFLPLALVISFVSRSPGVVLGVTVVLAIVFGAIHPWGLAVNIQVAISGLFFGLVFLKCGGLQKSFGRATIAAIAAHGTSNLFIVLNEWWRYLELAV